MKIFPILRMNLYSVLTKQNLLLTLFIFMVHFFISNNLYGRYEGYTIVNSLILFFYGPDSVNILFFKWLFHQVPIIVATGYFINIQFEERSIYFLPRVGNFHLFLNAIISTCFILVIIYYAIGLTVTVLLICLFSGSFMNLDILDVLKFSNEYPPNVLFINQFFLMILSTFLIILLNTLFTVLTKHSIVAFIITMIMIFVSVVIGYFIPELNKWLPYTQGMLAKHDTHNFTFEWSYIYVLSALIITIFLLNLLGQKYLETSLTEDLV